VTVFTPSIVMVIYRVNETDYCRHVLILDEFLAKNLIFLL
jgi:hypothetical protein